MDDTQNVVDETNAQVTPDAAEVTNAQEQKIDLDSLLKEFEDVKPGEEQKEPEQVKQEAETEEDDAIKQWAKIQMARSREDEERRIADEYKNTVKEVKGDLPLPEKIVDGYLRLRAQEDPRVLKAYQHRQTKPNIWKQVVEDVRRELKDAIKNAPDTVSTSTRAQVAEAIQNAKSTNSDIVDKPLGEMSDYEFEIYQRRFINS